VRRDDHGGEQHGHGDRGVPAGQAVNRCPFSVLHSPVGRYDVRRYDGDHDLMIREVMSTFRPSFPARPATDEEEGQT